MTVSASRPRAAILQRHHMHGAFYINTGYVGTGDGRFTWQQLRNLQADGNEIAGHTLTHRDLPTLSPEEQAREICVDRKQLIEHGLRAVDFAYPFGSYDRDDGEDRAHLRLPERRAAWGLWGSGCESTPADCPYAVDPSNLQDRWAIPTADAPIDLTYLIDLQRTSRTPNRTAGDGCGSSGTACQRRLRRVLWAPTLLDQFLGWLEQRAGQGTVVETPQQVLGETWRGRRWSWPASTSRRRRLRPPAQPAAQPRAGAVRSGGRRPLCWELSGGADWSRVPA